MYKIFIVSNLQKGHRPNSKENRFERSWIKKNESFYRFWHPMALLWWSESQTPPCESRIMYRYQNTHDDCLWPNIEIHNSTIFSNRLNSIPPMTYTNQYTVYSLIFERNEQNHPHVSNLATHNLEYIQLMIMFNF